jgi:DNA helicase-2/ATP-dependent DNA helicase PcrA
MRAHPSFIHSNYASADGSELAMVLDDRGLRRKFRPEVDPFQEQAINAREKTIRIVAPAGSGKTQTVLNRVLRRVREGVPPERILILTFDNAAVRAIVSKLRGQYANSRAVQIQTLNALGYEILRNDFPQEYKPVVSESHRHRLLWEVKSALRERSADRFYALPLGVKDSFYLEFFSLLKNELFDPRDLQVQRFADFVLASRQALPIFDVGADATSVRHVIEAIGWMFKAYDRALEREGLSDFDDQKLRTYLALRKTPKVRRKLQEKYSEFIVDEFQDINRLDFALIKLLAERSGLVITGDDDQSIYGFRNCSPDFIIDLENHLGRKVTSYELKINYRNPANLAGHAARLIGHSARRIPKNPIFSSQRNARIEIATSTSVMAEAKLIASTIQKIKRTTPGIRYRDFAVLFRINTQSLALQIEFALNGIPYVVSERDHILRNEALDRLIGFLRLKLCLQSGIQPDPEDAVLTLKAYFERLGAPAAERLYQLFQQKKDFYEAVTSNECFKIAPRIRESRLVESIREAMGARPLTKTLSVLASHFQEMRGMAGDFDEAADGQAPLGGILDVAASFGSDTARFVEVIETARERARKTKPEDEGGVALLTYFKSKGLEWHSVILTGCNEGIIPHKRATVEDERRLFYVAMTRASSNLLVSYVKRAATNLQPSRFLAEAGLIEK